MSPASLPAPFGSALLSTFAVALMAFFTAAPCVRAEPDVQVQVETRPNGFAFQLAGSTGDGSWILQHSRTAGTTWEDVLFLEDGTAQPSLEIQLGALAAPNAREGLFRAIQLESDDPFRRRFLTERTKWRLSGNDSYQFELSQNAGQISWHGIVNVTDGAVSSFVTIDQWPPGFEPDVPTIDELFERIEFAIAANAVIITVSWDRVHGAPLTGFIDIDELLADEERSWSILSFTPAP